jgi:ribosome-associated translation inhibitor RaiA
MQVQLNTDKNIHGDDTLAAWVETELKDKLVRFRDQITRIEVHLSDTSGPRNGDQDKRCKLEARLAGRQPVLVSHDAGKTGDAVRGAIEKLQRALDTTVGRLRDAHGRDSVRGASQAED